MMTKPKDPPHDGSAPCPFCPLEVRNLAAVAHNLLTAYDDPARRELLPDRIERLRKAVAEVKPLSDAHFANRMHYILVREVSASAVDEASPAPRKDAPVAAAVLTPRTSEARPPCDICGTTENRDTVEGKRCFDLYACMARASVAERARTSVAPRSTEAITDAERIVYWLDMRLGSNEKLGIRGSDVNMMREIRDSISRGDWKPENWIVTHRDPRPATPSKGETGQETKR